MNNSKLLAKNTIIMYIRMFVMMIIGLYTSRVILNTLGIEDYGIYNVVGGVVAMFSIISSSLSSSVSRFLTFEIGRGDFERLKQVFSTSVVVQIVLAIGVMIIIEILGVWFLNYKMNIPAARMEAANFVMQCSILSFGLSIINTPFNASIIAHERFGIFAYLTLSDSILKLLIVFLLSVTPYDPLKTYAILLLTVTVFVQLIYLIYCRRHFNECRFELKCNKALIKEMGGFAGWSFFGNTSWILNSQGIDILINLFFGVTLNAARGIANQVNNIVQGFVSNFMTALNPQITKSYAKGDFEYLQRLVFQGAKYSYFLMLFFALPLCLETKQILVLWLKIIPEYAVPFVRLTLISTMIFVLGNTLTSSQSACGKIKKSAIVTSLFTFVEFPLTYICFYLHMSPVSCYIIHIVIYALLIFIKIWLVKEFIKISYLDYCKEVLLRTALVTVFTFVFPFICYKIIPESNIRLFYICILSMVMCFVGIYYIGINKNERMAIITFLNNKLRK